jgi:hypothetical protein
LLWFKRDSEHLVIYRTIVKTCVYLKCAGGVAPECVIRLPSVFVFLFIRIYWQMLVGTSLQVCQVQEEILHIFIEMYVFVIRKGNIEPNKYKTVKPNRCISLHKIVKSLVKFKWIKQKTKNVFNQTKCSETNKSEQKKH